MTVAPVTAAASSESSHSMTAATEDVLTQDDRFALGIDFAVPRRVHGAREHRVDGDPVPLQLRGHHLGELEDRRLAHLVGSLPTGDLDGGTRGHDHDPPACTAGNHRRSGGAGQSPGTEQVGGELALDDGILDLVGTSARVST